MNGRAPPEDLEIALGAALGTDLVSVGDEFRLAKLLREVGDDANYGISLLLRALADALDHPDSEWTLKLGRGISGRPSDPGKFARQFDMAFNVWAKRKNGASPKRAVSEIAELWDCSRASVLRAVQIWKNHHAVFERVLENAELRESQQSGN